MGGQEGLEAGTGCGVLSDAGMWSRSRGHSLPSEQGLVPLSCTLLLRLCAPQQVLLSAWSLLRIRAETQVRVLCSSPAALTDLSSGGGSVCAGGQQTSRDGFCSHSVFPSWAPGPALFCPSFPMFGSGPTLALGSHSLP